MKIHSDKIIKNTFIDISIEGSNIIIEDNIYNNIYTIIITFYNDSYWFKGFDLYEKNIFTISKNTFSYINLIKSNHNIYTLTFYY